MTSHVIDLTWSGQFQIITHSTSQGWLSHQSPDFPNLSNQPSDFWINLLNQPFESTYAINLFIELAALLACGTSLPLTNVRMWEDVLLLTEVRMIQVVNFLTDHPLIEAWGASPLSILWWRCGCKPSWKQLGLLSYVDVSFVFYKTLGQWRE